MEKHIEYWELFVRQKSGALSAAEERQWDEWKNADASNKELLEEFELLYTRSDSEGESPDFDPEEKWEELQTIIRVNDHSNESSMIKHFPRIARIAAAILLVLGVSSIVYFNLQSNNTLNLQTIVQSGDAEKTTVALPDGTVVMLNRQTELLYPEAFEAEIREVYLQGEAFFDVAHDASRPFIIHAGTTKSTVLGTSFNLRAYSREDQVKLSVVTGKVSFTLADEKEGVIIEPGDMAIYNSENKRIHQQTNRDINFLSWKTGKLVFDNTRMDSLLATLASHFQVALNIENQETRLCRFTGDFQDIELENALRIITRATGTSYTSDGDSYNITGTGSN